MIQRLSQQVSVTQTVTAGQCDIETVTSGQCDIETVTSGQCDLETVTAGLCDPDTVTAGQLDIETVTSGQCVLETVIPGQCDTETVTAGQCDTDCHIRSVGHRDCHTRLVWHRDCHSRSVWPRDCHSRSVWPRGCQHIVWQRQLLYLTWILNISPQKRNTMTTISKLSYAAKYIVIVPQGVFLVLYFMRCPQRRMYSLCLCSLCGCASPGEAAVPRVMSTQAPGPRITSTPRLPKDQKLGRDIAPASVRQQGNDFPLSSQTLLAPTRHDSEKDLNMDFKYFPMYLGLYLRASAGRDFFFLMTLRVPLIHYVDISRRHSHKCVCTIMVINVQNQQFSASPNSSNVTNLAKRSEFCWKHGTFRPQVVILGNVPGHLGIYRRAA